jgi:HD-like signal output (HDOD) protein
MVAALRARLVEQLRASEIQVPPYPAVARALQELRAGTTIADVARIVATDAAIAAAVLRRASTAASRSTAPATLTVAIGKLGLDPLVRLVLELGLGQVAAGPGPLAVLRRDQWRRALISALLCRELAARRGLEPDVAYVAGLLHDFGGVILLACIESPAMQPRPVLSERDWRFLVDDLHIEFGMVVAARWELPEAITEVITSHHRPQLAAREHRALVQLVATVDEVIDVLDEPTAGIDGLVTIAGLAPDERRRIVGLMPAIADQMAKAEAGTPAPVKRGTAAPASAVAPATTPLDDGFKADFTVSGPGRAEDRACAISSDAFMFRSRLALTPAWLAELVITTETERIPMIAHVVSCEPSGPGSGELLITVRPFGLGTGELAAWKRLVESTQPRRPTTRRLPTVTAPQP